ncbi:MAG: porin family protein [Prevotella sp.]
MKKMIVMVAMAFCSAAAFAQHSVGTVTVQPRAGMSIASLTDIDDSDCRIGIAAGAELEYQVTDMISLSGGLLYSMQGVKGSDDDMDVTVKMDYLNIPLLANVYVAKGLAVKFGLQPGFNLSAKAKAEQSGVSAEADIDGVKSIDLSIPMGASYEFSNFVVDARYNWGLTKVMKDSDCKNSVFQITVGYKLPL